MDIWQIESTLAIAKHLNYTRAAEGLCISQSALSIQIKKLEEELGVKLFERTTRSLRLTPAGQEFITLAAQISSLLKQTKRTMEEYVALERGHIIVGALPIMGYLGIPSLIAGFKQTYPGVTIEIREADSDTLLEMLKNAEIDIALFTPPYDLQSTDFVVEPLFSDEVVLVTDLSHPFTKREVIELSEAGTEKHILMKSNYGLRETLITTCEKAGFKLNVIYECAQVESILGLVAAGLGVAFLNIRIPRRCNEPTIKYVRTSPTINRNTVLAMRNRSRLSPTIGTFRDFTLEWAKTRF